MLSTLDLLIRTCSTNSGCISTPTILGGPKILAWALIFDALGLELVIRVDIAGPAMSWVAQADMNNK